MFITVLMLLVEPEAKKAMFLFLCIICIIIIIILQCTFTVFVNFI